MKKLLKIMVLMIILMPVIIYGKTYSEAANKAKNYMETNYKDTYSRYLYDGKEMSTKLPFGSDGQNGSETNAFYSSLSGTVLGGLLNKQDYLTSKPCDTDTCRSYLYDGQSYWTLTAGSDGHYTVGVGDLSDNDTSPAVRVVEFVKHETVVTGRGTKLDPWKFKPKNKITVRANGGRIGTELSNLGDKAEKVIEETSATFYLDFDAGSSYLYNTCGLTTRPSTPREITDAKQITFMGITSNINCEVVFGKGLFRLTIPEEAILTTQALPNEIFVKFGERFYEDSEGKRMILSLSRKPERTGYDFKGYEYEISATNKVLVVGEDGKFVNSSTSKITENKELKSKWEAKKITISLNPNGGSGGAESAIVTYDSPYASDSWAKPTKTGHSVSGWFTAASGGTQRKNDDIVKITETETLYAHWSVNDYTITYNANGGTGAPSATTYTYATSGTVNLSSTQPTRSGYRFLGWSTSNTASSATYSAGGSFNKSVANNTTLYAVWSGCGKGTYLSGNTCENCPANKYSTGSANASCTSCPDGYTSAAGSDEKADCTISCNANYRVATADAKCTTACSTGYIHSAHTVKAGNTSSNCSAKTIEVTFHANYSGNSNTNKQTFTYGKSNQKFANTGFTRSGYNLKGWSKTSSGAKDYNVNSGVTDNWINTNAPSINLYAVWEDASHTACKETQTVVREYPRPKQEGYRNYSRGYVYKNKTVNGKSCTTKFTMDPCSGDYCYIYVKDQCGGDSNSNPKSSVTFEGYIYKCCVTGVCNSCACAG